MKLFIISDIHGSFYYLKKALEAYEKEQADYILILGDILYHGARNPIPPEYNTLQVATLLNKYSNRIIAVRGNCDSDVDLLVIEFPIESLYSTVLLNDFRIFLTHGHIYNGENLPNLRTGDVLFHGHTHVPVIDQKNGIYIINPGSITFPKDGYPNSYGILRDNIVEIKDLEGNVFKSVEITR
ncbi:MAG TPA: phosphodiesterase [Clostridiaceae bacterium]|nr:phosphodiesterase [Clostridiaceae bacterium]